MKQLESSFVRVGIDKNFREQNPWYLQDATKHLWLRS